MSLWDRYRQYLYVNAEAGVRVDISRMRFPDGFFEGMAPRFAAAFAAMKQLEAGAIANPDEQRQVGHYWLRDPARAPDPAVAETIVATIAAIKKFAASVHAGEIDGSDGFFQNVLVVGIGGSALGPQLVAAALGSRDDKMKPYFLDNTDPDGFDRMFDRLHGELGRTLTVVVSKSGGTKETRNGMLEVEAAYQRAGLDFAAHAVAVTGAGSELDRYAISKGWIERFPMWDWVGGRTSELSAVGLLPAALQGLDIDEMLRGARTVDELTRVENVGQNPAALLAAMWFYAGEGRGKKDMVILPYKDRLELFSRYLQQLVMESLGKQHDLAGAVVNQGIAVYGNKGSTDQHAYVQQLRDGLPNFFVTFIEVLRDRELSSLHVDGEDLGLPTAGDYLQGFLRGTREALYEGGRDSITITIDRVSPFHLGGLIALYERAVGFYASLTNLNAYHQPGVEAGKKAATAVLRLQAKVLAHLKSATGKWFDAETIARAIGAVDRAEDVLHVLEHAAANPDHQVAKKPGAFPAGPTFSQA